MHNDTKAPACAGENGIALFHCNQVRKSARSGEERRE